MKGEYTVNFAALRHKSSRFALACVAFVSSVMLGSCGGGGATQQPEQVGSLTLLPATATLYAGVVYTFQIVGGQRPYLLSSSEPTVLPVPDRVDGNSFQVVPNNPAVVDTGTGGDTGILPQRTVIITVRDALGNQVITASGTTGIRVAQNFLTGYGVTFTSNCGQNAQGCAGQDSIVTLIATSNGVLYGNRQVRFCVVRGQFQFVVPESPSNPTQTLTDCVTTMTDHQGVAIARIRVPSNANTQLATLRVIDVATGVFADQVFTIEGTDINAQPITILPNSFTFTGPRQGVCGTGSGDFLVFDGDTPYTAISSDPNVQVFPSTTSAQPGRFTVTASNPFVCVTNATIVVTDAAGRRATVTVNTAEGTAQLPALAVSPTTVSLNDTCGFTTSVTAVGGTGPLSVNSTHPRVSAVISGNTVTITRLRPDPAPPPAFYPTSAVVSVTDGSTIQNVTVNNVATFCP
jgi:hypothetical protein